MFDKGAQLSSPYWLRAQSGLVVLLCLLALSGCASLPRVVKPPDLDSPANHQIYVASHGWHTGLIVPGEWLRSRLPALAERFPEGHWIEVGWGDAGFYQSGQITVGLTLRAIFWPTRTVLHVVEVPLDPTAYFSNSQVMPIAITAEEKDALLEFIQQSFALDEDGLVQPSTEGLYGNSQFYAARGHYYLFNTCNKWTAKALSSAGQDIRPMFKLTASSVMHALPETGHKIEVADPSPAALE